jgi:hypothetical protein
MTKQYQGETGTMWEVSYSLIKRGDKTMCAWCEKDIKEIEDLDKHLKEHDDQD